MLRKVVGKPGSSKREEVLWNDEQAVVKMVHL